MATSAEVLTSSVCSHRKFGQFSPFLQTFLTIPNRSVSKFDKSLLPQQQVSPGPAESLTDPDQIHRHCGQSHLLQSRLLPQTLWTNSTHHWRKFNQLHPHVQKVWPILATPPGHSCSLDHLNELYWFCFSEYKQIGFFGHHCRVLLLSVLLLWLFCPVRFISDLLHLLTWEQNCPLPRCFPTSSAYNDRIRTSWKGFSEPKHQKCLNQLFNI